MQTLAADQLKVRSPFYRVTAKALAFDDQGRLLVVRNHNGNWELPGGGWEHDEAFEDCIRREILEETSVEAASVGNILFMYRGINRERGFITLRIVVPVALSSLDVLPADDITELKFVDREEFLAIDFTLNEGEIADYVDQIWPPKA